VLVEYKGTKTSGAAMHDAAASWGASNIYSRYVTVSPKFNRCSSLIDSLAGLILQLARSWYPCSKRSSITEQQKFNISTVQVDVRALPNAREHVDNERSVSMLDTRIHSVIKA
jgi:hypothetical protein